MMPSSFRILFILIALAFAGCADDHGLSVVHDADGILLLEVEPADLVNVVKEAGTDFVVVNMWAWWCSPCREEFPEFMEYDENTPDVSVRFLTYDGREDLDRTLQFLSDMNFSGETYMKTNEPGPFLTEVDADLTDEIALPATAIFNSSGELLSFWMGKVDYAELAGRINAFR